MFTVRVPATIANMGPGFDSLGMAVTLHNTFSFSPAERDSLIFSPKSTVDLGGLSEGDGENILFTALNAIYAKAGQKRSPQQVEVTADIPVARGLGSSSTAVIAGLVAGNAMLQKPFDNADLLQMAIDMEGHPDNVAPALLGGVVLYDTRPYPLPWPADWRILTLSPDYPVLTSEARRMLPQSVSLHDAIHNLRKTSVLTYALLNQDPEALRNALHDKLHQPYRRALIKEYDTLEALALNTGAFGMIISGSGSTMAIFYPETIQARLLEAVPATLREHNWKLTLHDVLTDQAGAVLQGNNST